jgi:antirestriction protein ArdC
MYLSITLKIKEKLEAGVIPWRKSWRSSVPMNFISRRPYNGINFISLILNEFPSPYYLTFLQCKEKNITIHKGATGSPIIFYKIMDYPVANLTGKENSSCKEKRKSIPIVKLSYVFNLSQTTQFEKENTEVQHLECDSS